MSGITEFVSLSAASVSVTLVLALAIVGTPVAAEQPRLTTPDSQSDHPTADFTYSPSTPNPDETITLDAGPSSDEGTIESYEWDTDGDGEYGEYYDDADNGETTTVSFDSEGTYTVGLRITDDNGNTEEVTRQVTVENPAPNAGFLYSPTSPSPQEEITLDASGSYDTDGSIESYEWDTDDDGEFGEYYDDADNGETTTVSYETGGEYVVRLRVTDNGGKSDTMWTTINVDNSPPDPEFSYTPDQPNPGNRITLDATGSYDPDGSIESYEWDTDGDGEFGEYYDDADSGETTSFIPDRSGTHEVGLRVTDNAGKSRTETQTITVTEKPEAHITLGSEEAVTGQEVEFSGALSTDSDGSIESYEWTLPSGRTKAGPEMSYTPIEPGTKTVQLTVVDNLGARASTNVTLSVYDRPTVDVTWSPRAPADHEEVTFETSSTATVQSYAWDFDGDGQRDATGSQASHRFPEGDSHPVTLTVTTAEGVETTYEETVQVRDVDPTATIDWGTQPVYTESPVTVTAASDDEIQDYEWAFDGDGSIDAEGKTVEHVFPSAGQQTVSLDITDQYGDTATVETTVTVEESPSVSVAGGESDSADLQYEVSNPHPETPIRAGLRLNLPDGVTVESADGIGMANETETALTTIAGGETETIRLDLHSEEAGDYNISGQAIYQVGADGNGNSYSKTLPATTFEGQGSDAGSADQGGVTGLTGDFSWLLLLGGLLLVVGTVGIGGWRYARSGDNHASEVTASQQENTTEPADSQTERPSESAAAESDESTPPAETDPIARDLVSEVDTLQGATVRSKASPINRYSVSLAGYDDDAPALAYALASTHADDEEACENFLSAARQWNGISKNPNVATVLEMGSDPRPWVAFAGGESLDSVLTSLDVDEKRAVLGEVAEAVRTGNMYNINQTGLEPGHIYVTRGEGTPSATLADWGIESTAAAALGPDPVTPYTAPEQLSESTAGAATDVYQLGMVSYHVLTETTPFESDSDLAAAIRDGDLPSPTTVDPSLPEALDDVIETATAQHPRDRFDSPYAFKQQLLEALNE